MNELSLDSNLTTPIKSSQDIKLDSSWKRYLAGEFSKEYMVRLKSFLISEIKYHSPIYPSSNFPLLTFIA